MTNHPRRPKKLILSIIGTAVAIPLIAAPASAALSGDSFSIRAHSTDGGSYTGTAGLATSKTATPGTGTPSTGTPGTGTPSTGTPGGTVTPPAPVEDPTVLATIKSGPLTFDVTQGMVDFSKANEALVAEGKEPKSHPDGGWKALSYYSNSERRSVLGYPTDGTTPQYVYLGGMPTAANSGAPAQVVFTEKSASGTEIVDTRKAPVAGATYAYRSDQSSYYEGRYIETEGKLVATSVRNQSGNIFVNRYMRAGTSSNYVSERVPFSTSVTPAGFETSRVLKPTTVDGSNQLYFTKQPGGAMNTTYELAAPIGNSSVNAVRSSGPTSIDLKIDGTLNYLRDRTADGQFVTTYVSTTDAKLIADHNAATGKNWDGSFEKMADYDRTIPFTPTPRS